MGTPVAVFNISPVTASRANLLLGRNACRFLANVLFLQMFTFRPVYFVGALFLFLVEVLIALYVTDRFVRPYFGDYLVVILMYCAVRAVVKSSVTKAAIGVLLFAYLVEFFQWMDIVTVLGLQHNSMAKTVMGTRFEWTDMLAYTLGILTVVFLENRTGSPNRELVAKTGLVK